MRRREFIGVLGCVAAGLLPHAARAQAKTPVIGFLSDAKRVENSDAIGAFRQGLKETGYVEGQNLIIEWRWAEGQSNLLRDSMLEFVRLPVAAIWASGNVAAQAAKTATTTIPIVFSTGDDPVATGLVSNFNRPDGNLTGVTYTAGTLPAKRLELLHELFPKAAVFGHLVNPNNRNSEFDIATVQAASASLGVRVVVVKAAANADFEPAFATLKRERAEALLINNDIFLFASADRLAELAARYAIPAINPNRQFPLAGGLMSYGSNTTESVREAGAYVGRILKGAKPAELPVLQPTKFYLVVNLKTAKAIGLKMPESFLLRADEVIE